MCTGCASKHRIHSRIAPPYWSQETVWPCGRVGIHKGRQVHHKGEERERPQRSVCAPSRPSTLHRPRYTMGSNKPKSQKQSWYPSAVNNSPPGTPENATSNQNIVFRSGKYRGDMECLGNRVLSLTCEGSQPVGTVWLLGTLVEDKLPRLGPSGQAQDKCVQLMTITCQETIEPLGNLNKACRQHPDFGWAKNAE